MLCYRASARHEIVHVFYPQNQIFTWFSKIIYVDRLQVVTDIFCHLVKFKVQKGAGMERHLPSIDSQSTFRWRKAHSLS